MARSISTGPLLLLLWQAAPYTVARDTTGRVRLSLGYAAGGYHSELDRMTCTPLGSSLKRSTKVGEWRRVVGELEAWPTRTTRAQVALSGAVSATGVAPPGRRPTTRAGGWRREYGARSGGEVEPSASAITPRHPAPGTWHQQSLRRYSLPCELHSLQSSRWRPRRPPRSRR